jgi:hypothetical protein
MHSKKYDNGRLWVACCECQRGGNGSAKNKCSAGGYIKKWDKLGCWSGVLSPDQIAQINGPTLKWGGTQDEAAMRWHQKNDEIMEE